MHVNQEENVWFLFEVLSKEKHPRKKYPKKHGQVFCNTLWGVSGVFSEIIACRISGICVILQPNRDIFPEYRF